MRGFFRAIVSILRSWLISAHRDGRLPQDDARNVSQHTACPVPKDAGSHEERATTTPDPGGSDEQRTERMDSTSSATAEGGDWFRVLDVPQSIDRVASSEDTTVAPSAEGARNPDPPGGKWSVASTSAPMMGSPDHRDDDAGLNDELDLTHMTASSRQTSVDAANVPSEDAHGAVRASSERSSPNRQQMPSDSTSSALDMALRCLSVDAPLGARGNGTAERGAAGQKVKEVSPDRTAEGAPADSPEERNKESPVDRGECLDLAAVANSQCRTETPEEPECVSAADDAEAGDPPHVSYREGVSPVPTRARELRRRPSQYRPPAGGPPRLQRRSPRRDTADNDSGADVRARPSRIELRVIFQRGGWSIVSLVARRPPGFPDELTLSSRAGEVELLALEDDWYQDVVPDNLADILRSGCVWTHRDTGQEWRLSGRDVFALTPSSTHRGYMSCPRLALGRNHAVLCAATQLTAVEACLREGGCGGWTTFREEDGALASLAGWVVLRDVVPQRPVPLSDEADILNVLRPLPEVEIALEGGIRLAYTTWLLGHPPRIRMYGDPEHRGAVLIDGQEASRSEEGAYTAPGWDLAGEHHVWCSGTTQRFFLESGQSSWEYWPAYLFSLPAGGTFEFCGPLVRPATLDVSTRPYGVVQVPPGNPLLLGPCPGDVFLAHGRPELRGAQCLALPPFAPVWALPAQPLRCDKRTSRVLAVGEPRAANTRGCDRQPRTRGRGHDVEWWCRLILDASRKGLAVEPACPVNRALWHSYKQFAREMRRRWR